jgi:hypothetical protein
MVKEFDAKSYWKGVKARRTAKVERGMDKDQAFKEALKEMNENIFALCDYASKWLKSAG